MLCRRKLIGEPLVYGFVLGEGLCEVLAGQGFRLACRLTFG